VGDPVSVEDPTGADALTLAARIATGDLSAREVTEAHPARIAAVDPAVGAFLHVDADGARAQADEVDARRAAGEPLGPLAGVPLALKDVIVQRGVPTTCGSRILDGWRPPYDATVVTRLRAAGVVILGKVNCDEFAMGSSTENSAFHPTGNPWALDRVPGGSSGGSAAAVAAHLAPLALGTDTGGSIRQPASLTGIVGAKPTYGGVSRYGLVAFASSLDQAGPMARTVADTAALHEVIAGHDPRDATSIPQQWPGLWAAAQAGAAEGLTGLRIGVIAEHDGPGWDDGVRAVTADALDQLRALGAEVVTVSVPHVVHALAAYYLIAPSEASSNLARFDGMRFGLRAGSEDDSVAAVMSATRAAGFGPEVKRRIMLGTFALSTGYYEAYYRSAQQVRRLIADDFAAAFTHCDALVGPTSPIPAFPLGERVDDPLSMYLADLATLPASLAGLPALSVPIGLTPADATAPALPVGLQVIAAATADATMYRVAGALESVLHQQWGGPLLDRAPALPAVGT